MSGLSRSSRRSGKRGVSGRELIIVFNGGSSSLKFSVFSFLDERLLLKGVVDRIGVEGLGSVLVAENLEEDVSEEFSVSVKNINQAFRTVIRFLDERGFLDEKIVGIGHRVVHGGEKYRSTTLINKRVIDDIDRLSEIAPLHNPVNLAIIKESRLFFPRVKQFAVFDTAFHSTLTEDKYLYGLPYALYKKYGIRKYGFHGINHEYCSLEARKRLDEELGPVVSRYKKRRGGYKIIVCHLGNGSSVAAVKNGVSVDTSMGFSPLDGLIMGTRSGQLDPAIIFYLGRKIGFKKLEEVLNKESGLKGITGLSDMRLIWDCYQKGRPDCVRAMNLLATRIKKYIGMYAAILEGCDAIVFSGGIGEKAFYLRELALKGLDHFGVRLSKARNGRNDPVISSDSSRVRVFVIPAHEELMIARKVKDCLRKGC